MISDKNMALQQGAGAAMGMAGCLGVYLGAGNGLGILKLPAAVAAVLTAALLLLGYRRALIPGGPWRPCLWDIMTAAGLLISAAWLYWGMIQLWSVVMGELQPFWFYGLIPLGLFPLVACRGEKAALRCAPVLLGIMMLIFLLDTVFVIAHMDIELLTMAKSRPLSDIVESWAHIVLCLIVPGCAAVFGGKLAPSGDYGKARIWGTVLIFGYMIAEVLRELLLFGDMMSLDKYPVLRALKSADSGVGVSRLEFLGIAALSMGILLGIMLIFSSFSRVSKELLGKKSRLPMIVGTAGIYGLAMLFYRMGQGAEMYSGALLGPVLLSVGSLLSKAAAKRRDCSAAS